MIAILVVLVGVAALLVIVALLRLWALSDLD